MNGIISDFPVMRCFAGGDSFHLALCTLQVLSGSHRKYQRFVMGPVAGIPVGASDKSTRLSMIGRTDSITVFYPALLVIRTKYMVRSFS